jgi:hypothetical protein
MNPAKTKAARALRVGDLVEVRPPDEILATLDERGELDSLPFMPEMLRFCGRRFRVSRVALKLCDTINWSGMYRMEDAVHLEGVRCDGSAHGGCQAGCLTYWKTAWLRRVEPGEPAPETPEPEPGHGHEPAAAGAVPPMLLAAARQAGDEGEEVFSCQATELLRAADGFLPSWDGRQYLRDVRSGNATLRAAIRSVSLGLFNEFQDASRRLLPGRLRIHGGVRLPFIEGKLTRTPQATFNLQAGELVRVKSKEEIVATLDRENKNRGMTFDAEMVKYCGRQARVLRRVERIIDEQSGRMVRLKNPCIVLERVVCTADYHRLCPRSVYPYWREIWLERVEPEHAEGTSR